MSLNLYVIRLGLLVAALASANAQFLLPAIQTIDPPSVTPGASATVTITGFGFNSSPMVLFDGSPQTTTQINSGKLQVAFTAPASPTSYTVTVKTAGHLVSNGVTLQVSSANAAIALANTFNLAPTGVGFAYSQVAVGDFNGDGKPDIVAPLNNVLGYNPEVTFLTNNGNGGFSGLDLAYAAAFPNMEVDEATALATGDFNDDGVLDAVVAMSPDLNLAVFINTDGYPAPVYSNLISKASIVKSGNFTNSGKTDLVAVSGSSITIYKGQGNGQLLPGITVNAGAPVKDLVAADFNGDGLTDLMALTASGEILLINNGNGFNQGNLPDSGQPLGFVLGDFNNDGLVDVAVLESSSVTILSSAGNGSFSSYSAGSLGADQARTIVAGDFNSDGFLDLAVAGPNLNFLLNQGNGRWIAGGASALSGYISTTALAAADFNADGKTDLAAVDYEDSVDVYSQTAAVRFSPAALDFPTPPFTTNPAQAVTVTSVGSLPLDFTGPLTFGTFGFGFTLAAPSNTCTGALAPGLSCQIQVTATSTGSVGAGSGFVQVSDNGAGSPQFLSVTYETVVPDALLYVTNCKSGPCTTLQFPATAAGATSAPLKVTLANQGSYPLTISQIYTGGQYGSDFKFTSTCPAQLAASSSCTLTLRFTPDSPNTETGTLYVYDNSDYVNNTLQTISLTGIGVNPVSVSPTALTLATTYPLASKPQTIVVTNLLPGDLQITGISIGGQNAADFSQTNNCGTLGPNATCALNVTFKPSTTSNEVAGLTIANSGEGGPVFVNLTGTSQVSYYGFPVLTPSTLSFPAAPEGFPAQAPVILTNDGNQPWQFSGITPTGANPGDFLIDPSACVILLQAGQPCQLNVFFIPLAPGYRSATFTISGLSDGVPMEATLTLSGNSLDATPLIDLLTPESILTSGAAAGFTFTVRGAGFNATSQVLLNGRPLSTSFPQNTLQSLQATVPAGAVAMEGTQLVTVSNSGTGPSNTIFLPVFASGFATPEFVNAAGSPFGAPTPWHISVADINGDGKQDMASTAAGTGVAIYTGNGDGTFNLVTVLPPGVTYPVPQEPAPAVPFATAFGDFNNDGKPDLAVFSIPNSVVIWLGNGDGTFRAAALDPLSGSALGIVVGNNPQFGVVADFNGDGRLDLATSNNGDGTFTILLGNGDGTFTIQGSSSAGPGPWGIVAGDFNGDNIVDLAIANQSANTVSILLGNGLGGFNARPATPVGSGPQGLTLGDFNNDSKVDIAVANTGGNTVSILLGNGDGTFQAAASAATGTGPFTVATEDMNGDGKLDLVVANEAANTVSVLLGNGDGTFAVSGSPIPTGKNPYWVAIADWNNDGMPDIAAANVNSSSMSILLSAMGTATLSASSIAFGSQNAGVPSAAQNVVLVNTGNGPLTLTAITISGVNAADFAQTNACGSLPVQIATSSSCTVTVTIDASIAGAENATLTFTDNSGGTPGTTQSTALSGTGIIGVAITPASVSFGYIGIGVPSPGHTVSIINTSVVPISLSSIAVNGTYAADFTQTNTCAGILAPSASCTVTLRFKPAAAGQRTAFMTVTDSATGSPQTIALSGVAVQKPVASLSTSSLVFASTKVGTVSAPLGLNITNQGDGNLTISGIAVTGDFSQKNNCTAPLGPAKSCRVAVTFKPTQTGARSGSITVTDNGITTSQQVKLSGTGTP